MWVGGGGGCKLQWAGPSKGVGEHHSTRTTTSAIESCLLVRVFGVKGFGGVRDSVLGQLSKLDGFLSLRPEDSRG